MEKLKITEKDNKDIIDGWFEEAKKQDVNTISQFINHVLNDYEHDYGTICHAITACAVAGAWTGNNSSPMGGITGFMVGLIMWNFIQRWGIKNNKCGLMMLNYDKMLYPQYESYFEKEIDEETWKRLQTEAKALLEKDAQTQSALTGKYGIANPYVKEHWESIIAGNIPFGYKLKTKRNDD